MDDLEPPKKKWILAAGWSLLCFPAFPLVHSSAGEVLIGRVLTLGLLICDLLILRGHMAARAAVVVVGAIWIFDLTEGIFAVRRYNTGHTLSLRRQARVAVTMLLLASIGGVLLAPQLPRIEAVTWQEEVSSLRAFVDEILHGLRALKPEGACDPSRQQCLMTSKNGLDYRPETW